MNHCNLQQNAFMSREELGGCVPIYCDPMNSVVCPKPRRANNVIRPLRLHYSQSEAAADACDSKAKEDLLDIIRRKEESLSSIANERQNNYVRSVQRRRFLQYCRDLISWTR